MRLRKNYICLGIVTLGLQSIAAFGTSWPPQMQINIKNNTFFGYILGTITTGSNYGSIVAQSVIPTPLPVLGASQTSQVLIVSDKLETGSDKYFSARINYSYTDSTTGQQIGCSFFIECRGVTTVSSGGDTYYACMTPYAESGNFIDSKSNPICKLGTPYRDSKYITQFPVEIDPPASSSNEGA